tara:strand:+ start:450 stop:644 length:195 start_codon:yes stop_codon:yes gene_type:complete
MINIDNPKITVAKYSIAIGDKDPSSIFIVHDGITTSVPMDENNIDYKTILQLVSDKKLTIKDAE